MIAPPFSHPAAPRGPARGNRDHSALPHSSAVLSPAPRTSPDRNAALDFTKGALVVCMVAYHSINYFRYDPNLLRHLHFLPPSFIFIAGFLITHLYLPKILAGDTLVYRRLFIRGLKTLALFLVLNLLVQSLVPSSYNRTFGLAQFLERLDVILLAGEVRGAVFGVLLPISYVLLLSSALLRLAQSARVTLYVLVGAVLALCLALDQRGRLPFNADLVSLGLLGTAAGWVPRSRLDQLARPLVFLLAAYAAYSLAVRFQYPTYAMNLLGVTLSALLLYAFGLRFVPRGRIAKFITLLGNYSLLSYLVQIALLQALFRAARYFGVLEGHILLPFLLTLAATVALIGLTHALRSRAPFVDRAYRAIFA